MFLFALPFYRKVIMGDWSSLFTAFLRPKVLLHVEPILCSSRQIYSTKKPEICRRIVLGLEAGLSILLNTLGNTGN
jgi:hypothetical protein